MREPFPWFQQRGGALIGFINVTWPFAVMTIRPASLHLCYYGREYRFAKSEIRRITEFRGLLTFGVRVEHEIEGYPRLVVFWSSLFPRSSRFLELKENLLLCGYELTLRK